MFEEFAGKTVFVTGGGGGIGKATAKMMGELGAKIFIVDVNEEILTNTISEFKNRGIDTDGSIVNVMVYSDVERVMKQCVDKFSSIDILVNCAGIYRENWFVEMTEEQWRQTIDINLNGMFNCCHVGMKYMTKQKSGNIVNLTSQAGVTGGSPQHTHYATSKAGVIGLTVSLAKEAAPYNIRVNCVAPGIIKTPMTAKYTPEQVESFISKIPLARFGEPEEAASIITFLASDMASYMTGQTLNATGGWLVHS